MKFKLLIAIAVLVPTMALAQTTIGSSGASSGKPAPAPTSEGSKK
jgi:uncharacterized protein YdeI (BOF family)